MSLYDDASLILYPSGYKEDKIYSLKPTDGSGDLTFTRASTATRVNSEGLIEESPVNLLLQSNSFSTTWTNTSTTETSGQSGYDGTNNAWLLTKPATSFARIQQTFSSTSGLKTFSVYLKAGTLSWCRLFAGSAPSPNIYVNLSNGSLGSQYDNISATSTDVGAGWYRVSLTFDASISEIRIYPADANDSVSGISGNIYIQDAQLNIGATALPYFPTTDRLDVPRIDYTGGGCGKLLLEGQRTNLALYSEQFDNAAWTKVRCTITANQTTSPDGTTSADLLTSTATLEPYIENATSVTVSGTQQTISCFVKKGTSDFAHFVLWDSSANGVRQWFDLTNGTTGGSIPFGAGVSVSSASIKAYTNGWYKCIAIVNCSITSVRFRVSASNANFSTNSTIGKTIYVWGYEINANASYPTSYIPTTSTSVTRLADEISTLDITSFSIGNSYTILIDAELNALENNKVFFTGKTSANTDSFTLRNVIGQLRLYNTIDSSYPLTSYSSSTNKWVLKIDGTSYKIFYYGGSAASTFTTARNFGKFNFEGSSTELKMQNLIIFPSALSDADCIALTL